MNIKDMSKEELVKLLAGQEEMLLTSGKQNVELRIKIDRLSKHLEAAVVTMEYIASHDKRVNFLSDEAIQRDVFIDKARAFLASLEGK